MNTNDRITRVLSRALQEVLGENNIDMRRHALLAKYSELRPQQAKSLNVIALIAEELSMTEDRANKFFIAYQHALDPEDSRKVAEFVKVHVKGPDALRERGDLIKRLQRELGFKGAAVHVAFEREVNLRRKMTLDAQIE